MKFLKRAFKKLSITDLMVEELLEAERSLLSSQTALEWATANVSYNEARVKRLRNRIQNPWKQE